MRAIALPEPGSTPAVLDLPDPIPAAGEVLVRVAASSLNGFDIAVATGRLVGMMEHVYPVVIGKDFAGTVEALGEGVDTFAVGDAVFGVLMKPVLADGTLGELVAVNAAYGITHLPDDVDVAAAGALGLAGAAALGVIVALDPHAGQTVLVVGATGGVGSIVSQYAAAAGARVIATAKPGAEADFVRAHGASDVVDPQGDLIAQVTALAPAGVEAIAHLAGDATSLLPLLAPEGRLASTLGFGADQHAAATAIGANPDAATLDRLAADVASGALRVPVTRTFTLDDAPGAIAAFPEGTLGKHSVVLG
jgi:NADPH:quinone reductase-like Zn-dependent oxidoreductase